MYWRNYLVGRFGWRHVSVLHWHAMQTLARS